MPLSILVSSVLDIELNCYGLNKKHPPNVHLLKLVWPPGDEDLNSDLMMLLLKAGLGCWDQRAHINTSVVKVTP